MLRLLRCLLAAVLFVIWPGCRREGSGALTRAEKPDIILISIDSLRADHLGCYGYGRATSPTIDRLSREGVRCVHAVSTTSWTLPSHAAMLTGLYDSAHGLVDNGLRLAEEHVTLAEVLGGAGYQTAGFFGGPYLHPTFGFGQGFETYESCMTKLPDDAGGERVRDESRSEESVSHADVTGPRTLERFSSWLESADDRPMFVFLHLWDVHYDYIPPKGYAEMFDPDYSGEVTAEDYMRNGAIHAGMAARDLQHVIALYDAEIRFTDDILGQILERLEQHGRLEDALVVVTADHGQEFFEHGGKGHQRTLHEEVIRVPLIFRWRGRLPAGRVVRDQVRLIDLMPTVLGLAGVASEAEVQGRDLTSLLRGGRLAAEPALCELLVNRWQRRALRTNRGKVVVNDENGAAAYFDLVNDPGEMRPLSPAYPGFEAALAELRALTERSQAICRRVAAQAAPYTELSDELKRRLEALGYTDGDEGEEKPGASGAATRRADE